MKKTPETGLREALLYKKLADHYTQCHVCQWQCKLAPGQRGVCCVRQNIDGSIYALNYAEVTSLAIDPIEKKPLYHFFPGTKVFSLGSWGCNFHCIHCQNWEISCINEEQTSGRIQIVSPENAVRLARENNCQGIAWTYNEPSIWLEYALDCARIAKSYGLYTVYVTNGFSTSDALDTIGPYLDAYRVDIKGFSDAFYKNLAKIYRWHGILEVTKRARDKWNMHIEVITNIIPTMNDDKEQLGSIAQWIHNNLGELTPWHITRFHPSYQLPHLPATPLPTLEMAYNIGREKGLRFVYIGNVAGNDKENTVCYLCGNTVIQRNGYQTRITDLTEHRCGNCGAELNIRAS